jgi:hypothetical protein
MTSSYIQKKEVACSCRRLYRIRGGQCFPLPPWALTGVCYLGIVFFSGSFGYALYRLFIPKPAVIISREGIFDNASAVGAGMLRWEEIAEIFPYELMGQRMLGIVPIDEEAIINRQSPIKRVLARMNKGLSAATFNIPQSVLPISIDELLVNIQNRRRDSLSGET